MSKETSEVSSSTVTGGPGETAEHLGDIGAPGGLCKYCTKYLFLEAWSKLPSEKNSPGTCNK